MFGQRGLTLRTSPQTHPTWAKWFWHPMADVSSCDVLRTLNPQHQKELEIRSTATSGQEAGGWSLAEGRLCRCCSRSIIATEQVGAVRGGGGWEGGTLWRGKTCVWALWVICLASTKLFYFWYTHTHTHTNNLYISTGTHSFRCMLPSIGVSKGQAPQLVQINSGVSSIS